MDEATAEALLASLLERLEADALSQRSSFGGLISPSERAALRIMIEAWSGKQNHVPPAQKGPFMTIPSAQENNVPINKTVLDYKESPNPNWILCLDFGTAKSKAFAATDSKEPDLYALSLGKRSGDPDGSVYAVSSSVWIDDDGRAFSGADAIRRGTEYPGSSPKRRRLDSLKQKISRLLLKPGGEKGLLGKDINPTSVKLTYEDAITFYLGYLTALATSELATNSQIGTRYVRRRFTLPCWEATQRKRAAELLSRSLARAQVLADTFQGKWQQGIPAADLKNVLDQTAQYDSRLTWLIAPESASQGILEPVAAASSRVWTDRRTRDLMLVVDVGAGTTDFSLFHTRQNLNSPEQRKASAHAAFDCGSATIPLAGDTLDFLLVEELLNRVRPGADSDWRQQMRYKLYLRGVRRLKETLFEVGEITEVIDGVRVTMTRNQLLETDGVAEFSEHIRQALRDFLSKVDQSWAELVKDRPLQLALTGGGNRLPMIRSLKREIWPIAGTKASCVLVQELPQLVEERFDEDFHREYPQLAVAMGGAMPMRLDEGSPLRTFPGATQRFSGLIHDNSWV